MCIATPLTSHEATVLNAYTLGAVPELGPQDRAAWAMATQDLVGRGMLERLDRGILVTPEGLAACLDSTPIEVMRTASQSGESAPVRPDAPKRPSRAPRKSAARSARRAPKRS